MAIKLTRKEFESYERAREGGAAAAALVEEHEWYSDDNGNILGIIILDKTDQDWAYIVQGKDDKGVFRYIESEHSLPDKQTAQEHLVAMLDELQASGKTVFPQ